MKKILLLPLIIAACLVTLSFKTNSPDKDKVYLYGLVYNSACEGNEETTGDWTTAMSDKANYKADMDKMKRNLERENPKATRIKIGSSYFDYGDEASNMCIIKITNESRNCVSRSYIVAFGTTQPDARRNAEKAAKEAGHTNYDIVTQKYW